MAEKERDSGRWARLGSEFGVSEFKGYEKYGARTNSMEGQAGKTRERGWSAAGGRSGARPGTGGGAHERGKEELEVRQGYNTNATPSTSDVVIRLAHPVTPSSTPPLLLPILLPALPRDYY